MVLTTTQLNALRDEALQYIEDNFTHIAVGSDNTPPTSSDTALGTEITRKTFQETDDTVSGEFTMSMRLATTEGNGNTIKEVGVFDAGAGGNMLGHKLTPSEYAKTSSNEVWIDFKVTMSGVNV